MRMVMLLVGLLVIGGLRVTHLAFVGTDPILLRFAGLHLTPSDRTVVAWLKAFTPQMLEKLSVLIRELVYDQVERYRLTRLTIDLDGTVLRTGAKVDSTERGFSPHHPKDPSYYPLTAFQMTGRFGSSAILGSSLTDEVIFAFLSPSS